MKTTQIKILIFFLSISCAFSLDFDLEKITLPYDNLELHDISVYNETILCRAENKVYRSEDDGKTWAVVFDAPHKINHFYSLNAHTMFLVGDSGMVYRSMDYGNNWINLSIDTKLNLMRIAAKDYSDCLVITGNRKVFHKEKFNTDWIAYDNFYDKANLLSVVYAEDKYFFGGTSTFIGTHHSYGGGEYDEYEFHSFILDKRKISSYQVESGINGISDSLKLFNIDNRLYSSAVYDKLNFFTFNKGWSGGDMRMLGFYINTNRFVNSFRIGVDIHIVINFGAIYSFPADTLGPYGDTMFGFKPETTVLNTTVINDATMAKDSLFYMASVNSNIYKVKLKQTKSSVKYEDDMGLFTQNGDIIQFDPEVDEYSVYNYLGERVSVANEVSPITLKNGIYIIIYKYHNISYSKKIMVGY